MFNFCCRCWSTATICTENGTFPRSARSSRGVTCCKMWPSRSSSPAEVSAGNSSCFVRPQSVRRAQTRAHSVSCRLPESFSRYFARRECDLVRRMAAESRTRRKVLCSRLSFYVINILPALRYVSFKNQFIVQSSGHTCCRYCRYFISQLYRDRNLSLITSRKHGSVIFNRDLM